MTSASRRTTSPLTMSNSSRPVPSMVSSSRSIAIEPLRLASGLRISCAIPAASSPTAARRSERRICSSMRRIAVRSWKAQTTPVVRPSPSRSAEKVMPSSGPAAAPAMPPSTRSAAAASWSGLPQGSAPPGIRKTAAKGRPMTAAAATWAMRSAARLQ